MTEKKETQKQELQKKVEEIAESKEKVEEVKSDEADEVQKRIDILKAKNDAYDAERLRAEENRARELVGGKAEAGQPERTEEDVANEKAKETLSVYGLD